MNQSNEQDLVDRFAGGDVSAFEEIVCRYQDRIYNTCRYMLGPARDAEDAAQDVFIKAFRKLPGLSLKSSASLSAWLYRVAVNTCIDYRRKPAHLSLVRQSTEGDLYELDTPSASLTPEESFDSARLGEVIEAGLGLLSDKLRTAIVLREIEGLTYEEIAVVLDISTGTVKSRISRAREEMRAHVNGLMEQK